jgi:hypothetical protein
MKQFLLLSAMLISSAVFAQIADKQLVGKWQIKTMKLAGIYHNFQTDSTIVTDEFKQTFKGEKDSAMSIALLTMMLEALQGTGYIFLPDGSFHEFKDKKQKTRGKYQTIAASKKLILKSTNKISGKKAESFTYAINNNALSMKLIDSDKDIVAVFEKVEN